MNLKEFTEKLEAIDYPLLRHEMAVRYKTPDNHIHCPITAVCEKETGDRFNSVEVNLAAKKLGIENESWGQVARMADFRSARDEDNPDPEIIRIRDLFRSLLGED